MKIDATVKFYEIARQVKSDALARVADAYREHDKIAATVSVDVLSYRKLAKVAYQMEKEYQNAIANGTDTDAQFAGVEAAHNKVTDAWRGLCQADRDAFDALQDAVKNINKALQNPMLIAPVDRVAISIPGETKLYRCTASELGIARKEAGAIIALDIIKDANGIITSVKRA